MPQQLAQARDHAAHVAQDGLESDGYGLTQYGQRAGRGGDGGSIGGTGGDGGGIGAPQFNTNAPLTLTGAVYHINTKQLPAGHDADPTMLVARAMYALSKRTDLYLSVAHAKANEGQLVGLSRDDAGTGTTQTGVAAGIQHRF